MRRLLPAIVTVGLALGPAVPAFAANHLPSGVNKISVTLTFPLKTVSGSQNTVRRTLTKAATVAEVVSATNALPTAAVRGVCPMLVVLGPELTVVFRNSSGTELAAAQVQVVQGSRGESGSSRCFPIRLISSGKDTNLLGNSWVRLIGRLIGKSIS
jgi:hypothetical protein